jgi:hypothetical protein
MFLLLFLVFDLSNHIFNVTKNNSQVTITYTDLEGLYDSFYINLISLVNDEIIKCEYEDNSIPACSANNLADGRIYLVQAVITRGTLYQYLDLTKITTSLSIYYF